MAMPDMFGEKRIQIKGDNYLNAIAQHIYDIYQRDNSVVSGDNMGQINRQVHLKVMMESGLATILTASDYKPEAFSSFYLSKSCPTEEETARALRGLISEGIIPVKKSVILKSEQFKSRISSSMR